MPDSAHASSISTQNRLIGELLSAGGARMGAAEWIEFRYPRPLATLRRCWVSLAFRLGMSFLNPFD